MRYPEIAAGIVDQIARTQEKEIRRAAEVFADAIAAGGVVHLFGCGHSRMGVEELFPRIGSIVGFHPIVELSLTYYTNVVGTMGLRQAFFLERVDGLGETILANYTFDPRDAAMVISSTGINNVPVEVALGLRARGIPVVGVTSVAHSSSVDSRHPSGKHLYEAVDIVLDNCSPPGDAAVEVPGAPAPVGATSTLGTVVIAHTINELLAEGLVRRGVTPVVLASPHAGDEDAARTGVEEYLTAHRRRTTRVP